MFQPPSYRETPSSAKAAHDITSTFLNQQVLVTVSDGRYFQGQFVCVDHECNIILHGAHEYQDLADGQAKRWTGMVMIPGKHLVEVCVKAEGPQASSLYM